MLGLVLLYQHNSYITFSFYFPVPMTRQTDNGWSLLLLLLHQAPVSVATLSRQEMVTIRPASSAGVVLSVVYLLTYAGVGHCLSSSHSPAARSLARPLMTHPIGSSVAANRSDAATGATASRRRWNRKLFIPSRYFTDICLFFRSTFGYNFNRLISTICDVILTQETLRQRRRDYDYEMSYYPSYPVDFTSILLALTYIALFVGAAAAFALTLSVRPNQAFAAAEQQQQQQSDNNNNNNANNNNIVANVIAALISTGVIVVG